MGRGTGLIDQLGAGPFWALMYGLSSMSITLFNKAVLTSYDFQYPMLLTVVQSAFSLLALYLCKKAGILHYPDFSFDVARRVAPLSIVFIFYVVISLAALGAVNVPMFTALRRTTIVFVMITEYIYMGSKPSQRVLYSVGVMVLGAIIAASKDMTFDLVSYVLVIVTNIATALYTVNIASVKKETKLSPFGLLYYNNVITLPLLLVITYMMGEFDSVSSYKYISDPGFQLFFCCSACLAFFLNVATYFSTTLNNPTTQSVVGQLKNFAAFILGLFLFTDYIFHPVNFFGLLFGFCGGLWYAKIKYDEKVEADRIKAAKEQEERKARDRAALLEEGCAQAGAGDGVHASGGDDDDEEALLGK